MSSIKDVEKLAAKATKEEQKLLVMEQKFALENKEFASYLKQQEAARKKINAMWDEIKVSLIEAEYFDVIENENFRVSVSKVAGIKVTNIDELPEEFTEVVKVAKMDKIKKFVELYEELPAGVVDSSYYRLNKKVK